MNKQQKEVPSHVQPAVKHAVQLIIVKFRSHIVQQK